MIIQTFHNRTAGLKSHVSAMLLNGKINYAVDVFDTDARQFLASVKILKDRGQALKYARRCVAS